MCGITGAIWTEPARAIDHELLGRMTDELAHRGPDDQGIYHSDCRLRPPYESQPGVALGHRRLSIIDVQDGGQPMANEDATVWIVFNGEIYNYVALRQRLEGAGHRFQTQSDTEVIVHLYEDEGIRCLEHLNGMFSFAIWDSRKQQLFLARDRLGQKPLVYCLQPDRLLFASELKSLLQVPDVSREMDPSAVDEYLTYQYVPHPKTIFASIRKLPPAHYAIFSAGRLEIRPYWAPDFQREVVLSPEEYGERVQATLRSAVDLRMRSDVPLGAFLSGGMDSSIIVALMQQLNSSPVKTFSVGFPVAQYDETDYARRVAEHLGTEHHEFQMVPDCVDVLPKLVWNFDEPFGDSSAIPTWYLSQWTREHVTVALTGDGGDELFAGYNRYRAVRWGQRFDALPRMIRTFGTAKCWQSLVARPRQKQKSLVRLLHRFLTALGQSPARRYLQWVEIFHESQRAELYSDEFLHKLPVVDPASLLEDAWRRATTRDDVTKACLVDLVTYLPCDLMTKVDMASMSHGLECRQPMLDHRLVELAIQMPIQLKMNRSYGKRVLWQAHRHLLPPAIGKRSKMGFGVPLGHWFRHELRDMLHDVLLGPDRRTETLLDIHSVTRLMEQHDSGRFDHGYRLWALLVLELWMRQWCNP